MFKYTIILAAITGLFLSSLILAEEERGQKRPQPAAGMKIEKVGDANILLPKDSVIHRKNGVVSIESPQEYTARKFGRFDERFESIEKRLLDIEDRLEDFRKIIMRLKRTLDMMHIEGGTSIEDKSE